MRNPYRLVIAAGCLLCLSAGYASEDPSHGAAQVPDRIQPETTFRAAAANSVVKLLPAMDVAALSEQKQGSAAQRRAVALNRYFEETGVGPLSSLDLNWAPAGEGWTARFAVTSSGARALRVAVVPATPGAGLEFRFREPSSGEVLRPIIVSAFATASGASFWSPVAFGDTVEAEVFAPAGIDLAAELFTVSQLSHFPAHPLAPKAAGACQRDVACYSLSADGARHVRSAVMTIVTDSTGNSYACSATMLNTDPASFIPYLLTNPFCVVSQGEASTMNTFWNYQATTCGGSAIASTHVRRTGGATLLRQDESAKFAFLRLNDEAPPNSYLSGWHPQAGAALAGTPVLTAHHPERDLKKVNLGSVVASGSTLSVRFTSGVTEFGSIGSAIVRDDMHIIGVLDSSGSSCANPTAVDAYAPFAAIWPHISAYLRPSTAPQPANYSDIWWNPSESGWGITVADHETQLFVVWYTYRADGSPTWFVIPGGVFSAERRLFSGDAYQTTGPPYDAPFSSRPVTVTRVGTVSFDFAPPGLAAGVAVFSYNIGGTTGTKQIQRQPFGNAGTNWGTDLTELWYDPSESGWGLSINQHGNNAFSIWYTYDRNGQPLFVVMPGVTSQGPAGFSGELYTTRGPWFGGPFNPSQVQVIPFGDATVSFENAPGTTAAKVWRPRSGKLKIRTRAQSGVELPFNKVLKQQRYGNDAPATPPSPCIVTWSNWSSCQADGFEHRVPASKNPPGCASEEVEFRVCSPERPCTSYSVGAWSPCTNGTRSRTVTGVPAGCSGSPPASIEACSGPPACNYTPAAWSSCVNGTRTHGWIGSPSGCVGTPPNPVTEACGNTGAACSFTRCSRGGSSPPGGCSCQLPRNDNITCPRPIAQIGQQCVFDGVQTHGCPVGSICLLSSVTNTGVCQPNCF